MSNLRSSRRSKQLEESVTIATLRKTELEAQILKERLSLQSRRRESLKAISGASGLLLVLVSVLGGGFSFWKWLEEQRLSRENQIEERLDSALASLSSERAPERVSAIGSLRSFISTNDERNKRVLVLASNALSIEPDRQVRNNILSFFQDVDESLVDQDALSSALAVQVHFNRDQTRDLGIRMRLGHARTIDDDLVEGGAQLQASSLAIRILVGKGAYVQDMVGVSLVGVNMQEARLPDVKFDNAILAWANFSGSRLDGASILNANLRGTSFVQADLREAAIGFDDEDYEIREQEYVLQQLRMDDPDIIQMPMFGCANLSSAKINNMIIFGSSEKFVESRKISTFSAVDFYKSNLSQTKFINPIAFRFCESHKKEELSNRCVGELYGSIGDRHWNDPRGSLSFHQYDSGTQDEPKEVPARPNESSPVPLVQTLERAFEGALVDGAVLPAQWKAALVGAQSVQSDSDTRCEEDPVHPFVWVTAELPSSAGVLISDGIVAHINDAEN